MLPNHELAESIDSVLEDLLIDADRQCIRRFDQPYSPENAHQEEYSPHPSSLTHDAAQFGISNCPISIVLISPMVLPTSISSTKQQLKETRLALKILLKDAPSECRQHLAKLQALYDNKKSSPESKVLKQMIRAEDTKQLFKKLKYLRHKKSTSALHRIFVPSDPTPNPKTCNDW